MAVGAMVAAPSPRSALRSAFHGLRRDGPQRPPPERSQRRGGNKNTRVPHAQSRGVTVVCVWGGGTGTRRRCHFDVERAGWGSCCSPRTNISAAVTQRTFLKRRPPA